MTLALTARDLAAALLGRKRAAQTVHRVTSIYGGEFPTRHVVLVTPYGQERGEYYEVSDREKRRLEDGASPEELELEPFDPTEEDMDSYEANFNRIAMMRRAGAF